MIKKYNIKTSNIYFISNDTKLSDNYDTWTAKYNIPKINIITLNRYLEEAKPWVRDIDKYPIEDFKTDRIREKKFTCLNGAFREHRLKIVSELFRSGLENDGYISYIVNTGYNNEHSKESEIDNIDKDLLKYYMDSLEENQLLFLTILQFLKNEPQFYFFPFL